MPNSSHQAVSLDEVVGELNRSAHPVHQHLQQVDRPAAACIDERVTQARVSPPVDPAVIEAERLGKSINNLLNDIIISSSTTSPLPLSSPLGATAGAATITTTPTTPTTAGTAMAMATTTTTKTTTTAPRPNASATTSSTYLLAPRSMMSKSQELARVEQNNHHHLLPSDQQHQPSELGIPPILISNDELLKYNQLSHPQALLPHAGRGKKWQPEEDELLAQAWLRVSEDPSIVGDTFWNRVSDEFLRLSPGSRRPPRSIQQRWAKLHQSISQFGECYEEQESRLPTGTSTESITVEALKLYKSKTDSNFGHYSCWTLLRHTNQWTDHLSKPRMLPLKRKLNELNDDDSPTSGPVAGPSIDVHPRTGETDPGLGNGSSKSTYNPTLDPPEPPHHHLHHASLLPASSSSQPLVTSIHHPFNPNLIMRPSPTSTANAKPSMVQPQPSSPSSLAKRRLELSEKRIKLIEELTNSIKRKNEILEEFNKLERETNQIKIMSQFKSSESEIWFKLKQQEILNEFNLKILN